MERILQVIEGRCFQVCVTGCVEKRTGLAGKFECVVFVAKSTGLYVLVVSETTGKEEAGFNAKRADIG